MSTTGLLFEHNAFRFHIRCPIFVAREWFRHRIGCLTGDAETRVAPLQVRQLTALVQASTGAAPPILRHNATTSGHAGGQPRS